MTMDLKTNPQFPIYIPSKGRSQYMITSKILSRLGVPHFIIVEPQELEQYCEAIGSMNLLATPLVLDLDYKKKYELCDSLGLSRSTGPGPARNFAWDHSKATGNAWHWVMDDNIMSFRRLNLNEKVKVSNGAIFRAMEDFVLRYTNVAMAGPNYFMFASARNKMPPFTVNTRIYSCNLIRNNLNFRWRGRYNEDTILSLDILKAGWCTIQFNAFLQEKMPTQTIPGGNSGDFYFVEGEKKKGDRYADNGTLAKSQMQVAVHPDVSQLVWKFGRWHHHVDYRPFKKNNLILKPDVSIKTGVDNYGMTLSKK
jgi:hypothetical protein